MRPVPSEVRSIVSSWQTTNTPSLDRWMSHSMPSAFMSTAIWNDASVFSGAYPDAPR